MARLWKAMRGTKGETLGTKLQDRKNTEHGRPGTNTVHNLLANWNLGTEKMIINVFSIT